MASGIRVTQLIAVVPSSVNRRESRERTHRLQALLRQDVSHDARNTADACPDKRDVREAMMMCVSHILPSVSLLFTCDIDFVT